MKKKIYLLSFLFLTIYGFSQQQSINDFKYIIVPSQFSWLNKPDQYKINSFTKFLFEKHGRFTVFFDNESFPNDLAKNRCMALVVDVKKTSSFLTTKNIITLKDCNNKVIFTSTEGKSKEKEYKKAFYESIRKAFQSIKSLQYNYNGTSDNAANNLLPNKEEPVEVIYPDAKINVPNTKGSLVTLYAQKIPNGFQLVNTKPAVIFIILKSSKKDFYFLKDKNGVLFKKGDIWVAEFYKDNIWVQEKYQIKF